MVKVFGNDAREVLSCIIMHKIKFASINGVLHGL